MATVHSTENARSSLCYPPSKQIGQAVREARTQLGLSLVKTGKACGLSDETIRQIEHGKKGTTEKTLCLLAAFFGLPTASLSVGVQPRNIVPPLPNKCGVRFAHVLNAPGYCVGDDGSFWSCRTNRGIVSTWRKRKTPLDNAGYPAASLWMDNIGYTNRLHCIILEAFVGPRPEGMEGCHNNNNKSDCRLVNLRWDTPSGNQADTARENRSDESWIPGSAKIGRSDVRKIRLRADSGDSPVAIAADYPISEQHVRAIISRRFWAWLRD